LYTVYLHTNKIDNKKYVGITCQEPYEKRFNGDGSGYKNCVHFWNAIKKFGWENFEHKVLERVETEKEAMAFEKHYIALFQSDNDEFGYNIKSGGEHQHYPQEIRDKISKANMGRKSPTEGKHHSEETKRKIRDAQKGRKFTPEHAENVRVATRKYYETHSPAHTFTEEDHKRAKEACQTKIRVVETGQVFDSMTDCANHFGVLVSNLSRAIRFNRKYKGYHFEKISS